jgi:hypothetical protein
MGGRQGGGGDNCHIVLFSKEPMNFNHVIIKKCFQDVFTYYGKLNQKTQI